MVELSGKGKKMKSHELAKMLLSKPDMDVVMSSDSEGNCFEYLNEVAFNHIFSIGYCENAIYDRDWSAEEACMEEDEWAEFKKENPEVVVLWP